MKYLVLTKLLLVLFCTTACENVESTTTGSSNSTYEYVASSDQDTANYIPLYIHDVPENINSQKTKLGAFGQIAPPDLSKYQAQVLVKSIWTFEFYVDKNASRKQKIAGTGQWYQFSADGSFKAGHWQRQTHSGLWYMNYTTTHPTLIIDSNVDALDAWWEIQSITGAQDAMAWVRVSTPDSPGPYRKSIQGKLIELTSLPTKKQFSNIFKTL